MHKITHLLDLWEAKFEEQIADGKRSPTSLDTFRRAIKNHVRPALGELRIAEANTPRIDKVISTIKKTAGAPTARTCRAIISGMMQLAVRYGAISINPVREVDRIEHPTKKLPRALRIDEVQLLRKQLNAAGIRLDEPIFADTIGGYRDPTNVRRSLRTALSPVGSTARRDLGLTLRAARREAGLTREQVAKALNWPKSHSGHDDPSSGPITYTDHLTRPHATRR